MRWYEFTFEAPHPRDERICLRFVIEVPIPSARKLPKGSMLETRIRWSGGRSDA
jgi:hypothetical protein